MSQDYKKLAFCKNEQVTNLCPVSLEIYTRLRDGWFMYRFPLRDKKGTEWLGSIFLLSLLLFTHRLFTHRFFHRFFH